MNKLSNKLMVALEIIGLLATSVAQAEEAKGDPIKEGFVIGEMQAFDGKKAYLKLGGYVDSYYSYNFNKPADNANPGRIFDTKANAFTLGLAQTKFEMGTEDWEVVADLTFGPNAEAGNFGNIGPSGSLTSTAIKQAYVGANITDKLKLTAGQFGTHVGYEVIEAYANSNYSLSNLFGWGPFYHQGAKLDYAVMDGVGVMVGVANGWDSNFNTDNNNGKSALAQISLDGFIPNLGLFLNYVGGDETAYGAGGPGMRHIFDITASYSVNKYFSVGLNAAAGMDKVTENGTSDKWGGAAIYLDYIFNPGGEYESKITVRSEYFDDNQGVRAGYNAGIFSNTLTYTLSMYGGHFLVKPEFRMDQSNDFIYANAKKTQMTGSIAFIGVY